MRLSNCLLIAALLAVTFAAASTEQPGAAKSDQPCPAGTSPNPRQSVGDLYLPAGASPYSTILLTRHRLATGETLPAELGVPIMYVVESGVLEYPSQTGVGIMQGPPSCIPDDGHFSGGGSFTITEDNFVPVSAGMTMVAEHGLNGPLRAGGTMPLVMLEVRVLVPEIDPASGLPIVDPVIAAREQNRDFRRRKEACKARERAIAKGTPVAPLSAPPVYIETPEPTPAFTTAGWQSDSNRDRYKTPRICEGSRVRE